ncbi:hypothetical protein BSPLISOX_1428 [uncultured Gammaproteobacteria bacterium]|nr:hypothetical protein [uncultured Gammaproteobacteria bacterium]VVH64496.1 hypothetical protein BSPLISOX_1428 [uncultured Gammaproteobacteria bacterium]
MSSLLGELHSVPFSPKWLSIKSRVKGFLRMGIGVILDWFF